MPIKRAIFATCNHNPRHVAEVVTEADVPDGWYEVVHHKVGNGHVQTKQPEDRIIFDSLACMSKWATARQKFLDDQRPQAEADADPEPAHDPTPPVERLTINERDLLTTMQRMGFRRDIGTKRPYRTQLVESDRKKLAVVELFQMDKTAKLLCPEISELLGIPSADINKYVNELHSVGVLKVVGTQMSQRGREMKVYSLAASVDSSD